MERANDPPWRDCPSCRRASGQRHRRPYIFLNGIFRISNSAVVSKTFFNKFKGIGAISCLGKSYGGKIDELVKSRNSIEFVIPAKAGIELFQHVLDPGFRRGDDPRDFLRDHQD